MRTLRKIMAKSTIKKIQSTEQQINRLERKQSLQKLKERKKNTRRKIELGGLVIKAKMSQYTKDIILGALVDAKQQIETNQENKRLFEVKGQLAFLNKE